MTNTEPEFTPAAEESAKIAALRLVRELVIAKDGGPAAVMAPLRAMFALTSAGAPTMESAIIYLANTLADGIVRGYGPIALEEINRTLSAAVLGDGANSAEST